jgi:hypothetical protein
MRDNENDSFPNETTSLHMHRGYSNYLVQLTLYKN